MSPLSKARAVFGAVFAAAFLAVSAANALFHGAPVLDALATPSHPVTALTAGDGLKRAEAAANRRFLGSVQARTLRAETMARLGKREMNNFAVVKGPDGRLYRGGLYTVDTANAKQLGDSMTTLAAAAAERGAATLYVATPDTVVAGLPLPPAVMPVLDFNVATDALLYTLRQQGTPALDARYAYFAHGFPPDAMTAKTGPLLTGEAAFALFGYVLGALQEHFGANLDPQGFYRNKENYTTRTLPEFFMGELGKQTGPGFSGLDDFTTITAAFETEYRVEGLDAFGNAVGLEGAAAQTLLKPDALFYYDSLYDLYPESYYIHANMTWSRIENARNPDGPRILFIHDFQAAPLVSFLAPLCGELHTLAHHPNQTRNAEQYLEEYDFDYVIVSFFPENILRPASQALLETRTPPPAGGQVAD